MAQPSGRRSPAKRRASGNRWGKDSDHEEIAASARARRRPGLRARRAGPGRTTDVRRRAQRHGRHGGAAAGVRRRRRGRARQRGTLAAMGSLNVRLIIALLITASFSGDNVNYWIGRFTGPRVFHSESSRFLNRKHLNRTRHFYEKYGRKTIIIARFVPIVRTFAPFVAGIGRMRYGSYVFSALPGECSG